MHANVNGVASWVSPETLSGTEILIRDRKNSCRDADEVTPDVNAWDDLLTCRSRSRYFRACWTDHYITCNYSCIDELHITKRVDELWDTWSVF